MFPHLSLSRSLSLSLSLCFIQQIFLLTISPNWFCISVSKTRVQPKKEEYKSQPFAITGRNPTTTAPEIINAKFRLIHTENPDLMVLLSGFTDPVIIPNLTEIKCQNIILPSKCLNIYYMNLFVLRLECKDVRKIYFNALPTNYQWFLFLKQKRNLSLSIMQGKIFLVPILNIFWHAYIQFLPLF